VRGIKAAGYDRGSAVVIALAVSEKTLVDAVAHLARPEIDAAFGPSA